MAVPKSIRKITPAGMVSPFAGSGLSPDVLGVGVDVSGNMYVTDYTNNLIRKITPFGYGISPALPAGLTSDVSAGIISGIPTAVTASENYLVTATNALGSKAFTTF